VQNRYSFEDCVLHISWAKSDILASIGFKWSTVPGGKRSLRTPASPNNGGYLKANSRVTRTNVFQAIFCYLDGEFRLFSLVESGSVKVMHWAWGNGSESFAGEYFYFSLWTDVDSSAARYQEAL
jgi:hypothetical protein